VFLAVVVGFKMPGDYAFCWVGRGGKLCISADLKIYQGIKVEWIGSFAQPDIGNLPHPLTQEICVFAGPDMPNLPPCLYRFPSPASQNPQGLGYGHPDPALSISRCVW
jgi:hypothetical protein